MGMYAVQTADSDELAELGNTARHGRAAALLRRHQLSKGKQALNGAGAPRAGASVPVNGAGAPPATASAQGNGAAAPPAAANAQGAPSGAPRAPSGAGVATDGVAAAHLGRALSKERRRQLSQGKQALTAGAGHTAAAAGAGAPARTASAQVNGAAAPPAAANAQGAPSGAPRAPSGAGVATDGVAAAHLGRALSKERRRQLSQGKQALTAGAGHTAAAAGAGAPARTEPRAPGGAGVATDGVAAAHLGRVLSRERRRQLSQGKQALAASAGLVATTNGSTAAPRTPEAHIDGGDASGRDRAMARRAEASRLGSASITRRQREGGVKYVPKVVVSPTHGDQRVTGLRIGPGVRVTGDEAGASLPVSGTQYVPADGPPPAPDAGRKVGLARTPKGLVVSGTTVRNRVAVTGDEVGEHLPITGEADQKLADDLTPRDETTYRSAQFPRRADPHGASAVGTRLGSPLTTVAAGGDGPWQPLEATAGRLPVTGTAVGRSGRVTGNEAGACRPITGDQYQSLSSYSTECAGTGGGTAPAAHLNRARLDPVTGAKVSAMQTWRGQVVTGPSVEQHPVVTGDEPGVCHPVTGTPYQGPSTTLGWCEPEAGEPVAQRLGARPAGVAVTGDLPRHAKGVTGTERGHHKAVTGTAYYSELRPAEPAGDDWHGTQAFPVALARRLAGGESGDDAAKETDDARPPASNVAGRITGSFMVGEGKVTGNNEFLFRPRQNRNAKKPVLTGEGRTEGRTVTGAAWTAHDRVTGTEGYIAAGRNPTEGGGAPHSWAGATRFRDLATPEGPRQNVTGLSGWSAKAAARVTLSGGAQG